MTKINWFEVGKGAAEEYVTRIVIQPKDDAFPDCPWPIYAPEGIQWLRGWNSVAMDDEDLKSRPENHGNLFLAQE